jgi:hypothetical protein
MAVPETAVHEDNEPMSGKNYVGAARQIFTAQRKSESKTMEQGTDLPLRHRVAMPNAAHIPAALFGRDSVHASTSTCWPDRSHRERDMPSDLNGLLGPNCI